MNNPLSYNDPTGEAFWKTLASFAVSLSFSVLGIYVGVKVYNSVWYSRNTYRAVGRFAGGTIGAIGLGFFWCYFRRRCTYRCCR